MKLSLSTALTASALALAPLSAGAATVLGSAFGSGTTYNYDSGDGITATFQAGPAPRTFTSKTSGIYVGVGISDGRTNDEIDIDETLSGQFDSNIRVGAIQLMVLYDGPEFSDVEEQAQITATLFDNTTVTGILTIDFDSTLATPGQMNTFWSLANGATVTNLSPAIDPGGAAVWRIANPFGTADIKALSFTALTGGCGNGACTNQSDYALERIEVLAAPQEVPEPSTYAMMLAGLAMLGFMVRRRSQS
jgi:hypothetical protein